MAIVRTVLPRKGFVQPQHGLTQYEGDMDSNLSLLDSNVLFTSDVGFSNIGAQAELNDYEFSMVGGPLIIQSGIVYILASDQGTGSALLWVV